MLIVYAEKEKGERKMSKDRKNRMVILAIFTIVSIAFSSLALIPIPVMAQQSGPVIDRLRLKVIRSPDAQVIAMQTREIDVFFGMIRPGDIETLQGAGKTISSTPGFHLCNFMYNLRPTYVAGPNVGKKNPLHDVNFRHALAHLMPKARIVGTQFRYIVGQLDNMVPPAQAEWYNSYVDTHPFSDPATLGENCEAVKILKAAGYQPQGSWPYSDWKFPDGTDLPTMRVYIPLESVAPTSYQVGKIWTDQMHLIGLGDIVNSPEEFSAYLIKTYDLWDFEISWSCYLMGRFPDYLYEMMYSAENYMGSSNPHGIYWQALDAELETLKFGLEHAESVEAGKKAQELIAGGTPGAPLPTPAPTDDNNWNWSMPRLPVYTRNYYDSQQPELRGAINMRGQGIDFLPNPFAAMNIHWSVDPATIGRVDPDGKAFVIQLVDEFPERLNILWSKTVYAAYFYQPYEGLLQINPWTHSDLPWLAERWEYANVTGEYGYPAGAKMAVKFWLRDGVTWQDGTPFTVDDVKFAWEFMRDWAIPKFWYFSQYIVDVQTDPVENSVTAYMSRTSQWDLYDLAGTAAMLPPRVWEKNPVTGDPWGSVTEITSFDPAQTWADGPLPTYLYGTGPFIFKFYDSVGAYGDMDANRNYWLTTAEFQDLLSYYFWRSGDTDKSGKVYAEDMGTIGLYWGQTAIPFDPSEEIPGSWYDHPTKRDAHETNQLSNIFVYNIPVQGPPGETKDLWVKCRFNQRSYRDNDYVDIWAKVDDGARTRVASVGMLGTKPYTVILPIAYGLDKSVAHTVQLQLEKKTNYDPFAPPQSENPEHPPGTGNPHDDDLPETDIVEVKKWPQILDFDFNYDADFTSYLSGPPDGKTDLDDLITAAAYFGETVSVPP